VVPELKKLISSEVEVIEKGALDGLDLKEIKGLVPTENKEILVTRLSDGTEVTVGKRFIIPRLKEKILELNREDVAVITLLCSGEFPPFRLEKPLLMPDKLLYGVLSSISIKGKLGVMVPSEDQVGPITKSFQKMGFETVGVGASPYRDERGVVEAAGRLQEVDLTVMDCFGYNLSMKSKVKEVTGRPVILVRSILAKALDELV
jgi:protein AroM